MKSPLRRETLLQHPRYNKDAAFTMEEREGLGLLGLLPPAVVTIEQQVALELEHIRSKTDPLEQYIGLMALLDRNETLFYRLLVENLATFIPVLYTPTVGLACQKFSHIFRRPRGLYLCPRDKGHIAERLRNLRPAKIRLMVVTDNERILGLGDLGMGGMGIPIGKLMLYSAGAGIHPEHCLPICFDMGTNNETLLNDPYYMGYPARRLKGAEYDELIEEFVKAVKLVFPGAVLQWEDFKKGTAFRLMERYQDVLPSFNDDIQGTAAVVVGGILSGLRHLKQPLEEQRILHFGAGASGVGIGRLIRLALREAGLSEDDARASQVFFDTNGLLWTGRDNLDGHKIDFALTPEELSNLHIPKEAHSDLAQMIEAFKPTILIGTTGQGGAFTPPILEAMGRSCERPIIFALSNPTSNAECTPEQALHATGGRALVATGSPFPITHLNGRNHTTGQANNVFIFPGVGLGAIVSRAKKITDSMFLAAAYTLAQHTPEPRLQSGALYPDITDLRRISALIGLKVAQLARDEDLGRRASDAQFLREIEKEFWYPEYTPSLGLKRVVQKR